MRSNAIDRFYEIYLKTIEVVEKKWRSYISSGVSEAEMEKEMNRIEVCVYQHFGLIKEDNSCDLNAVVDFFTATSPYFVEQLPAPEKKLESLDRCLSKKSNSAEEAKDWILTCVKKDFRLYPKDFNPEEVYHPEKIQENSI